MNREQFDAYVTGQFESAQQVMDRLMDDAVIYRGFNANYCATLKNIVTSIKGKRLFPAIVLVRSIRENGLDLWLYEESIRDSLKLLQSSLDAAYMSVTCAIYENVVRLRVDHPDEAAFNNKVDAATAPLLDLLGLVTSAPLRMNAPTTTEGYVRRYVERAQTLPQLLEYPANEIIMNDSPRHYCELQERLDAISHAASYFINPFKN